MKLEEDYIKSTIVYYKHDVRRSHTHGSFLCRVALPFFQGYEKAFHCLSAPSLADIQHRVHFLVDNDSQKAMPFLRTYLIKRKQNKILDICICIFVLELFSMNFFDLLPVKTEIADDFSYRHSQTGISWIKIFNNYHKVTSWNLNIAVPDHNYRIGNNHVQNLMVIIRMNPFYPLFTSTIDRTISFLLFHCCMYLLTLLVYYVSNNSYSTKTKQALDLMWNIAKSPLNIMFVNIIFIQRPLICPFFNRSSATFGNEPNL